MFSQLKKRAGKLEPKEEAGIKTLVTTLTLYAAALVGERPIKAMLNEAIEKEGALIKSLLERDDTNGYKEHSINFLKECTSLVKKHEDAMATKVAEYLNKKG